MKPGASPGIWGGSILLLRDGKERAFPDEDALVSFLALATDTHGYADPARWTCPPMNRCILVREAPRPSGRSVPSGDLAVDVAERSAFRFTDAAGRLIDVRNLRSRVIDRIRCGRGGPSLPVPRPYGCPPGRRRRAVGQRGQAGHYLRGLNGEDVFDRDGRLLGRWEPRGRMRVTAACLRDPDWFEYRARRGRGWKAQKYAHQWERRVRAEEKRLRARLRAEGPFLEDAEG